MKKIELYFNQYCSCSYVSRTTLATGASVVQRIKALLVDCYNCQVYTNSAAQPPSASSRGAACGHRVVII